MKRGAAKCGNDASATNGVGAWSIAPPNIYRYGIRRWAVGSVTRGLTMTDHDPKPLTTPEAVARVKADWGRVLADAAEAMRWWSAAECFGDWAEEADEHRWELRRAVLDA